MLGKLIKYEFKSTNRIFLSLYLALILMAVVNRIFRVGKVEFAFAISTAIMVGLFIALGVITLIVIIQRFNKNLLGDEGYLMFTLPVKVHELVFSKLITSFFWNIVSAFVSFLTFIILLGDEIPFNELFTKFGVIWDHFKVITMEQFEMDPVVFIISMISIGILSYTSFIFQIYLSLSAAQLPIFNKYRGIIAFVAYFVINVIFTICSCIADKILPDNILNTEVSMFIFAIISMLAAAGVLFIGIKYILEKHLNLE